MDGGGRCYQESPTATFSLFHFAEVMERTMVFLFLEGKGIYLIAFLAYARCRYFDPLSPSRLIVDVVGGDTHSRRRRGQ